MIEHDIRKFVVRQKDFKDTPVTFIGDGIYWVALVGDHRFYTLPIKHNWDGSLEYGEPSKSDAYGAWCNLATANRLSVNTKRPYVMGVKNESSGKNKVTA